VLVRDLLGGDLPSALAINNASVPAVSELDMARFERLVEMAQLALGAFGTDDARAQSTLTGFCLVLAPGSDYSSVNYRWFCERYDDFAYLDRVAVHESQRSRGIGAALYAEVERRLAATWFTLEVNLRPRNDGSLRFHAREGFVEVGQQETDYGCLVSMQAKRLR
jgi:predicted GNAT superfamily acetyltransferase